MIIFSTQHIYQAAHGKFPCTYDSSLSKRFDSQPVEKVPPQGVLNFLEKAIALSPWGITDNRYIIMGTYYHAESGAVCHGSALAVNLMDMLQKLIAIEHKFSGDLYAELLSLHVFTEV